MKELTKQEASDLISLNSDYDLDMINTLQDYPATELTGYVYFRVVVDEKDKEVSACFSQCNISQVNISKGLIHLMEQEEAWKFATMNAVLSYFALHREQIGTFENYLKQLKQTK